LLVNYRELPQALFTAILPHFGVACVEAERAASRSGALTHKEMRYGDIGCSEVRGTSVLEALRMLKAMVDTIA